MRDDSPDPYKHPYLPLPLSLPLCFNQTRLSHSFALLRTCAVQVIQAKKHWAIAQEALGIRSIVQSGDKDVLDMLAIAKDVGHGNEDVQVASRE